MAIDVPEVLPVVTAPALVVHQRGDPWVRIEHGRCLAQHISGAAHVEWTVMSIFRPPPPRLCCWHR